MKRTLVVPALVCLLTLPACKKSETTTETITQSSVTTETSTAGTDASTGTIVPTETMATTMTSTTATAPTMTMPTMPPGAATTTGGTKKGEAPKKATTPVPPPQPTTTSSTQPVSSTTNPETQPKPVETAPAQTSTIAEGRSIFQSKCIGCHGADASGNTAMGKSKHIPDLRSAEVQKMSDAEIAKIIAEGKSPASAAAHKSRNLNSDQISSVIGYLRSIAK